VKILLKKGESSSAWPFPSPSLKRLTGRLRMRKAQDCYRKKLRQKDDGKYKREFILKPTRGGSLALLPPS